MTLNRIESSRTESNRIESNRVESNGIEADGVERARQENVFCFVLELLPLKRNVGFPDDRFARNPVSLLQCRIASGGRIVYARGLSSLAGVE